MGTSVWATPPMTSTVTSATRQALQASAGWAQGATALLKSCGPLSKQTSGGGGNGAGGRAGGVSAGGGDSGGACIRAGGGGGDGRGDGVLQLPSAKREDMATPAAIMAPDCALRQALMAAALLGDTPARMKGVASAVRQAEHALATFEHGVTAAVKSWTALTGQVTGGGGGDMSGGGNGEEALHELRAKRALGLTPAVMMELALELRHALMVAESLGDTPAMTICVASAVRQAVHTLAMLAHAETAGVKSRFAVMGHAGAGSGGERGSGGGGDSGDEPITEVTPVTVGTGSAAAANEVARAALRASPDENCKAMALGSAVVTVNATEMPARRRRADAAMRVMLTADVGTPAALATPTMKAA